MINMQRGYFWKTIILPRPFGRSLGIGLAGGAEYSGFDGKPLGICIRKVNKRPRLYIITPNTLILIDSA